MSQALDTGPFLDQTSSPPARPLSTAASRGFWMLTDQGVAAAGNFLTGVLLARYLPQDSYGGFGLLVETMLFLNSLQAGLVNYPLTVRGATGGRAALRRSATAALGFTGAMLPLLGVAMFCASLVSGSVAVALAAVAAMGLGQAQETLRRALISDLRVAACVPGDAVSYLGQVAAIYLLHRVGRLDLATALAGIAFTSALAAGVQALQVGPAPLHWREFGPAARDYWRMGRWVLMSNLTVLVTGVGMTWSLQFLHGLTAVAAFAAVAMMLRLTNPVARSVGALITPAVARARHQRGPRAAAQAGLYYTVGGVALLAPFFALLLVAPHWCLTLAFSDSSPYLAYDNLLRIYVVHSLMLFLAAALGAWLCGLGHSRDYFHTQAVQTVASLAIRLPLTAFWGLEGFIIGGLIASASSAIAAAFLLVRISSRRSQVRHLPSPQAAANCCA